MKQRVHGSVRWLEASLPSATVAFTGRSGGVSDPPFDRLNLGILTDDDRRHVVENRRRLATALGIDGERLAMVRQVHGSDLVVHAGDAVPPHYLQPGEMPVEADGHLTSIEGLAMLVLVADCLPVAISGPGGLAMLHCGWRGLAGSIVQDAAERIAGSDAVIGPGIGPCCFEVGDEVFDAFADLGPGLRRGRNLDLWQVAERRLAAAGVRNIETAGICTYCDSENYFSHRRDRGRTGRQAGLAWLT